MNVITIIITTSFYALISIILSIPGLNLSHDPPETESQKQLNKNRTKMTSIVVTCCTDAAVSLYPYGASVNDKQYVERKVDFNSPLFKPEIGIPLGKSLRNSLYVSN